MPKIADVLERESRTVDLEQGDFERLLARRDRRRRNRRIRAGIVGVIVALATGMLLARSLTSASVPANQPKPLGAGEVLTVAGGLVAQDPDSGEVRTIVDIHSLPPREGTPEGITGAAWSQDHRWVAFRASSLWLSDTVGGAPRQLTPDQGWDPWAWSPTEDKLAVVQGRDVTLIDAATGRETDLGTTMGAKDIEGVAVHTLVWSPDGTRIAYDGGPGWGSVYSIDVESGKHTLLVRQPAGTGEINDIDWSPDGAHLAIKYVDASYIAGHKAELGAVASKATALYVANADGSDVHLLEHIVASQWPVWIPELSVSTSWSPDGARLAYATFSGRGHHELQIWTVSVDDGSAPSRVATVSGVGDGGSPVWSHDASQIAFETETLGPQPVPIPHHDLVVNADGTGEPMQIDELMYLSWAGGSYFCTCYG